MKRLSTAQRLAVVAGFVVVLVGVAYALLPFKPYSTLQCDAPLVEAFRDDGSSSDSGVGLAARRAGLAASCPDRARSRLATAGVIVGVGVVGALGASWIIGSEPRPG